MRKMPRIYLNRDSVCLGDDISPHEREWIIRPAYDLLTLLNLCKNDFLPTNIQGGNPGWKAMWKGKTIAVIGQKWQTARIIDNEITLKKIKDENGDVTLFFEYLNFDEDPEQVFQSLRNS